MTTKLRYLYSLFIIFRLCENTLAFIAKATSQETTAPPRQRSSYDQFFLMTTTKTDASNLKILQRYSQLKLLENENTDEETQQSTLSLLPAFGISVVAISFLLHMEGWIHLYSSMEEMKANASSSSEFSSAFQFWLFGALSHPFLKPMFGISEILHASPGPKIAGLIPLSFFALSGIFTWLLLSYQTLRNLITIAALGLLLNFIGNGLDGNIPGDYDIQLDDRYNGKVIKGCPAPDGDVLLRNLPGKPTDKEMFDYHQYQGKWYWHKVHDWTQFQEMYDTTLDIRLTESGYVNTLTIKGPSPSNSPLSWDKSPLMNGVKYSWVGEIDRLAPPGTSLESGFGVTFPNYIVDVKTDENGNYKELIQFQCIEVGGVRLYEGIDFMSRNPTMTKDELEAMHHRAHDSGLDPYGSSPEQMHQIQQSANQDLTKINEENNWQQLWKRLDIERYLDQSLK